MKKTLMMAAAILLSGAAAAQTPAPASAPAATGATVPEAAAPGAMAPSSSAMSAGKISAADKKFIEKIGSAGLSEVQEAQLAQQKSSDPKVKDFAQTMITDHTANNQQLAALAQQKGLTAPTEPDAKDAKGIAKLQNLSGAKFDRAYMKAEGKDHEEVLKMLQKEAKTTKDADLKAFAEQTIPVIQKHIELVKTDSPT